MHTNHQPLHTLTGNRFLKWLISGMHPGYFPPQNQSEKGACYRRLDFGMYLDSNQGISPLVFL